MGAELIKVESASSEFVSIDALRAVLAAESDLDAIRDIEARAGAAAMYFRRVKDAREFVNQAIEARVWAERRLGQIIDRNRATEWSYFRVELHTSPQTVSRWLKLADTPEPIIEDIISEIRQAGRDLGYKAILDRLETKGLQRVERGIYRNHLGDYFIRWRKDGVSRQSKQGPDLVLARNALLVRTGKVKPQAPAERSEVTAGALIAESYSDVRHALSLIDRALPRLAPEARAACERAMRALYEAEDEIGRVLRETRKA